MNYISRIHGAAFTQFSSIVQLSKVRISVYDRFNELPTELLTILDSFYQYHNCLHRGGQLGVVGSHGSGREKHVRKLDLQMGSNKAFLSLKHHKKQTNQWITAINGQQFANLWPTGSSTSACLLRIRTATAISRPSEHQCMPDMPQKVVTAKSNLFTFDSVSVVVR